MSEEAKKIEKEHSKRIDVINRKIEDLRSQHYVDVQQLKNNYGSIFNVPEGIKKALDDKFEKEIKSIEKKQFDEIKRYMDEVCEYDARREHPQKSGNEKNYVDLGQRKETLEPDRE